MHRYAIRSMVGVFFLAICCVLSAQAQTPDRWSIVHAGTLLAIPGEAPRTQMSVIIKNGKVLEVRPGFIAPSDVKDASPDQVKVVELRDKFVMPGLIDCHVHLTMEVTPQIRLDDVSKTAAARAIDGVAHARATLMAGFTTVRDLMGEPEAIMALRDGVRDGKVVGPRIIAAGAALSPTGGHADPSGNYRDDLVFPPNMAAVCDGADACRVAVRKQVKLGADVIKFMATGGVMDNSRAGLDQQFTDEEMRAIVTTAHALGRKVAAHAHGVEGIKAALRAGVDSIEHGTFIDAQGVTLLKERGAFLVPTNLASLTVAKRAEVPGYLGESSREKALATVKALGRNIQFAYKAGAKIAFGTDSGVSEHGRNAEEFALMVKAGMSPMDAIRAATVSAADLLGLADHIGTVESGKDADMVATDRNPLDDITEMTRITFVMKGGALFKAQGLSLP